MIGKDTPNVLLVHGLWFHARWLALLAKRFEGAGFHVETFSYRTTRDPFTDSAARLAAHCARLGAGGTHLVGHSLGGLLILKMLSDGGWNAPGRALFLGTPLQGSAVARRTASWLGATRLIGAAARPLQEAQGPWPSTRSIGMIAGAHPLGLGVIAGGLERPHDGTVSVAETRHPGLADHVVMPTTHTGMIFSPSVARQAVHFLAHGRFSRGDRNDRPSA
jgi:alpha-beta hydrolase superfamily lysophospholipase